MLGVLVGCGACRSPAVATTCEGDEQCPPGYRCDQVHRFCVRERDAAAATADAAGVDLNRDAGVDASRDGAAPDSGSADAGSDAAAPDATAIDASALDAAATDAAPDGGTPFAPDLIALGRDHVCAARFDGFVRCWGKGSNGQLGYGDEISRGDGPDEMGDRLPWVDLGSSREVRQLAGGDDHTCVLVDDGKVKCWGENGQGQLGYGDVRDRGDGAGEMGDALLPVPLGTAVVTAIAAGDDFNCALLSRGAVRC
ncbi:MAG: hypothetical protein JXR83_01215, partial [Deltaproteobacteria bacterium]|nr:hypothetical protein [Deltaproteobacteria bacterium]